MMFYEKELLALKKSHRYRFRTLQCDALSDFASNDYLGLAHKKELHESACLELSHLDTHASKASMLVNGYHQVHQNFERALCEANGFEDGVVLGSGFCANVALIEALVRKGDRLFMDELYHASGVLASKIGTIDVVYFKHNDAQELRELLKNSDSKRNIVAIEGVYSMDGDLCKREIFDVVDAFGALLIVDEAHSSGVVGKKLMGVFDHYDITIKPNYIKMGTLGKAYGSFGAFILASAHIIEYLINRAKPIIYATSLSLYDTLLAHKSLEYILQNAQTLNAEIAKRQEIVMQELGVSIDALIVPLLIKSNTKVIEMQKSLKERGFGVGAIRQPTVPEAILRIIVRLGESEERLRELAIAIREMQ